MFGSKKFTMKTFLFMAAVSIASAESQPGNLGGLLQKSGISTRRNALEQRGGNGRCADGELGVGTWQMCSPAPAGICNPAGCAGTDGGCQAELGGIWQDNCSSGESIASTTFTEGFCRGDWHGSIYDGDLGVRCDGDGKVEAVTFSRDGTSMDGWNDCYEPGDGSCEQTIGIASKFEHIAWCCKLAIEIPS